MADNPMFYQKIVTLNREVHKDLRVDLGNVRYGFARSAHLIPAVLEEFFAGARAFPIVFVPGPGPATPTFLVGFEPGENLCVGSDGEWTGDYIPAFIRRYPFIVGEIEGGQPLICIDETSASLSPLRGEPLFNDKGEDAPHLLDIIRFTGDYMVAAKRTTEFVEHLQKLDLFTGVTIGLRQQGASNKTIHGAMSIDVNKFDALSDDAFCELRKKGFLQAIYSQISSMALVERLAVVQGKKHAQSASPSPVKNETAGLDELRREEMDLLN